MKDYNISSISADYNITEAVRIGALYSTIRDQDGNDEADGYSVGAYWKAMKNTTVYLILAGIDNDVGGSYQFAGSAPLRKLFGSADVAGENLTSVNVGFLFKF